MSRVNIFTVVVASLAGLLFGFDTAVKTYSELIGNIAFGRSSISERRASASPFPSRSSAPARGHSLPGSLETGSAAATH